MYRDDPNIMYENPPPPPGYEFDFDADPFTFTFPFPQRVTHVNFLKVDYSLIHKSLLGEAEDEEVENPTNLVRPDESTSSVEEGEIRADVNASEENNDKNGASKENNNAKETETEALQTNDKPTTSSALEAISQQYSRRSVSDSDSENQKKSKSSSSREKSHSTKSSRHRKDKSSKKKNLHDEVVPHDRHAEISVKQEVISSDEESCRSSLSKKSGVSVKEEVLSDKDDSGKDKKKHSKSHKKKHHRVSKNRYDDDHSREIYDDDHSRERYDDHSREKHHDDSKSRYFSKETYRDDSRRKHYDDGSSSDDSRRRCSDEDNRSKHSEDSRGYIKREIKLEPGSSNSPALNDFYCNVCKLNLNSETTFTSHIAGKRHKKALRQLSELDVAKSSILEITESQSFPLPPNMDRLQLSDEEARIQEACDDANLLIVGLDFVREIRGYEETKYYCELCSAQCVANSIIKHLIGFKHQIHCVKHYNPRKYSYVKDLERKDRRLESDIKRELEKVRRFYGPGRIKVFKDVRRAPAYSDSYDPYQPSTSRHIHEPVKKSEELTGSIVTDEDCLSRDFSDFYCKVCDAHMNNHSMWESHARGKRHAGNKKKAPEGLVSNSNFIEAPHGTISHLEEMIHEQCSPNDIIVGLTFIKENQGENGDLYNCFLCGSVSSSLDIVDHLFLRKHKTKYLEKMLHNGHHNEVQSINVMPISDYAKEGLIDEECSRLLLQVDRGRPVIAIPKKIF